MPLETSKTGNWPYVVAILLLSAFYYGLYFGSGFSAADDGNYAQIAYELYLGRAPDDLTITYGILWFKVGEALFHAFGVNYALVKAFFFTVITITSILIFYTIHLFSGSRLFALAMTAVPLLVPAFPATGFYSLCIMMNAAAQMRLASKITRTTWIDTAIAGAALSLSFQIRPDFGYIWTLPLAVLLLLAALKTSPTQKAWPLFGSAVLAFLVVQAPMMLSALNDGYVAMILQQYISYPTTMIDYALSGLRALLTGDLAQPDSAGSASLKRPGLAAIIFGDANTSALAVLIYLPLVAISGFVFYNASRAGKLWRDGRFETIGQALVALFAAAAAFPHYFFYRPDLSHVANFMPGYTVLAAAIVYQLYNQARLNAAPLRQWVVSIGLLTAVLHLAFYVWVGLQTPGTGSIAGNANREEMFRAGNGIDVKVSVAEKSQLEVVRNLILENTGPGDRIVCVPYCPGFAFMSERQMLFKNFYVDDSMPILEPNWISEAIKLTQDAQPAVVIVQDWAINGTEISRFNNWAADYITALKKLSVEIINHPGLTIYLL